MTRLRAKRRIPTSAEAVQKVLEERGALLSGHFKLSSGNHSDRYIQCALVLQHPHVAERLGRFLAQRFSDAIDVILSPALGGIILGQAVAAEINVRAIFAERVDGKMTLRRGFAIRPKERVLCVEDVLTTGGSVKEIMELARSLGGEVVGVAAIVERGKEPLEFGVQKEVLLSIPATTHEAAQCPLCQQGLPVAKPGSRPSEGKGQW